ncbi:YcaO-like family protein [Rhizobium leguminosarum]|uniref:YcaO-like family protein n=1 Tax=Rhizobium leguminosarum TaxID=384 RepID=UPI00102FA3AB|nr:YcaO-like family protein [Rhizobium leguminosarum]TBF89129.1 hypothetical protein ELG82_36920 [Rhizobium leguminosarum]
MLPFERGFTLAEAEREIRRVIEELELDPEVSVVGDRIFAARCALIDRSGDAVSSGLGKGDEQSAIVGALYEAVEHYVTKLNFICPNDLSIEHSAALAKENKNYMSGVIRSVLDDGGDNRILCAVHQSIEDSRHSALYPVGLFIPDYVDLKYRDTSIVPDDNFNYNRLGEYSSNTGVAIGMDVTEAVLHGVLEAAERDSVSRFLFNAFIKGDFRSVRKMDMSTLPPNLQILTDDVGRECSVDEIHVYQLPNRFGIPAYVAWINARIHGLHQPGFGCSLSEYHAIERSLYELAQGHIALTKIHDAKMVEKTQLRRAANLHRYPILHDCLTFDIGKMKEKVGYTRVEFSGHSATQVSPKAQIQEIVARIRNIGEHAFSCEFSFPVETSVKVVHTFISNSDRFMTVLGGRIAMPDATSGVRNG